jgi:hypothetical protein
MGQTLSVKPGAEMGLPDSKNGQSVNDEVTIEG